MTFFVCLGVVGFIATGALVCIKHDAPQFYAAAKRIVVGIILALTLGTALYAAEVNPLTCNDFEKYSFIWYLQGCWWGEHSS